MVLNNAMTDLEPLISRDNPIAVLAGAGVSLAPPSNLLAGGPFMEETLRRVVPSDLDASWMKSIRHRPEGRFVRPGEFLRFEVLMAGLVESGLDAELGVLECLAATDKPNMNHFVLASLIRAGCVVMTTNFDTLIEQAYAALAFEDTPLRVIYRDEDFPANGPGAGDPSTLWKLHGSLDRSANATRSSIQATMTSVLAPSMTGRKRAFLRHVLERLDLVTLGYSGSDDLDLIPVVAETPSARRLIWVSHSDSATQPTIRNGEALVKSCAVTWPEDTVGWTRLLFTPDDASQAVRPFENILEVSVRTADMVNLLSRVYECPPSPVAGDEHRFGSRYPDVVRQYFDDWFARLPQHATAGYELVEALAQSRACRAADQQKLGALRSRLRSLRRRWRATPHDHLRDLMSVFNEDKGQRSTLFGIRRVLARLPGDLSAADEPLRARLEACVSWCLEGMTAGEKAFRRAAEHARALGDPVSEFHTLVAWRKMAGYSQWSDLYPEAVDPRVRQQFGDAEIDRVRLEARRHTGEAFPDDENRQLLLLADRIGHLPVLWRLQMDAVEDVVDEHPLSMLATFHTAKRVLRFCVDVGDVTGEIRSERLLARLYRLDEKYSDAALHLLRVLELNRIVGPGSMANEDSEGLRFCDASLRKGYVDELRTVIQRSMWGDRVDSSSETTSR